VEADLVVISEIYASRETDTLRVSGADIVALMAEATVGKAQFAPDLAATTDWLLAHLRPGDLLLTLGAGDIWKVADRVTAAMSNER
jgi:UDP-N-acetylmuramate--alanine ligase